jgi:hypothetical protein
MEEGVQCGLSAEWYQERALVTFASIGGRERIVKRRHLLILVFALVAWSAATSVAGEMSIGAKVGLIASNVTGIPDEWASAEMSYKTGFIGGIVLNYAIDDAFSLQPELLYTSKGFTGNLYDGIIAVDVTPSVDYLELPVLAKYTFSRGGKFRPCVFAGPSLAYEVQSKLKISVGPLGWSIDISDLTHDTEFGLVAGAGFGYRTDRGLLTFDARYQRGFTNIIKSVDFSVLGSAQTMSFDDYKNYGFAFMAGYQF